MSFISANSMGPTGYASVGAVDGVQPAEVQSSSVDAAQSASDPQATCEVMAASVMASKSLEQGWNSVVGGPGPSAQQVNGLS